ncbi:glycosyltransferase family 4 protein [Christiangramia echinicola]|uniref:Glycosyltransferase involved in cell wall bisynthesis n=1 Tax=Christiangramia echinicola TaxID=279359 RepID=A0A1H1LU54_9FLAO|nr:glycosyltransferase family 4 protein [Christiangramia echinicola]SDR77967.1 Glycosyltransferase involved in cell wall bisynthesis [Christiangramia echinicola]
MEIQKGIKPKVLMVLHFPPPVHGAAMVGEYIKKSNKLNTGLDLKFINLSTSSKIDEIGKRGFGKWSRFLQIIFETFKGIFRYKPDLVYITLTTSGVGFYKDAVLALLVKLFGVKVIYHLHNKGVESNSDHFFNKLLYQLVFRKSKVILLSQKLFKDVEKFVKREQVFICPNGIPDIPYRSNIEKGNSILFLSNLIESKGVLVLLESCELLLKRNIEFTCNIVGGIGDITENNLKRLIETKGLQKHVNYLGKKYGNDKKEIFESSKIFAFPTYYEKECFPLVLLEAMQYALPIVTTSEGGIEDIVQDNHCGFIVPKKDSKALADKLNILLEDSELAIKFGGKGREKYMDQFDLEKFELRLLQILRNTSQQEKIKQKIFEKV